MYNRFFGFSENPFGVSADPRFLYLNSGLREMLAALICGINDRRGLMTIVGEAGTGKTTLLNATRDRLDEKINVAHISNTNITFEEMLTMVLADLGHAEPLNCGSASEALRRLQEFAIRQQARGGNVVLLIDEAQNLDDLCMKNLCRLIGPDTGQHKRVQVVFCGLPERDGKSNQPARGRLAEQVGMRWHIDPFNKQDTSAYIQHRLEVAGYKGPALFTRRAQRLIWEESQGVPQKINTLCETALVIGYTQAEKKIRASLIKRAIKDTSWRSYSGTHSGHARMTAKHGPPRAMRRISHARFALAASLMFAACLTLVSGLLVANSRLKLKSDGSPYHRGVVQPEKLVQPNGSIQSPSLDGQPVVFARASMGQGASARRISADNVKPSAHPGGEAEKEKRSAQVAFLAPVDNERIPLDGSAPSMGRGPLRVESAHEQATEAKPDMSKEGNTVIQVGAFRVRATAELLIRRLRKKGYEPYLEIRKLEDLGLIHRVRLGGYGSMAGARAAMARLQDQGFDDVFVLSRRIDRPR